MDNFDSLINLPADLVENEASAEVVTKSTGKLNANQVAGNQIQLPPIILPQIQSNTAATKRRLSTSQLAQEMFQAPASSASAINGKQLKQQSNKKQIASDLKAANQDKDWKCVKCNCPGNLTPVKRLGSDGKRNICNACYIRDRASKERGMKGSARPVAASKQPNMNNQATLQYQNGYYAGPQRVYTGYAAGYNPYMVPNSSNPLLSPTSLNRYHQQQQYYQGNVYDYAAMMTQQQHPQQAQDALLSDNSDQLVPIIQQQQHQQPSAYVYQQYPGMSTPTAADTIDTRNFTAPTSANGKKKAKTQ